MTNYHHVYVLVSGTPTDPLDADLPGVYSHSVAVPVPQDQLAQELQDAAICTAVLDEFHDRQGIEMLDDFTIRVVLVDGREIHERDGASAGQPHAGLVVEHEGKVTLADVPAAVAAARAQPIGDAREV